MFLDHERNQPVQLISPNDLLGTALAWPEPKLLWKKAIQEPLAWSLLSPKAKDSQIF